MPEHHVTCGGLRGARKPGALHIDVNAAGGSPDRVNLRIDHISRRLAADLPDTLTDLLEIAAYVYCADQFTARGTTQMTRMGADWRRRFHFRIPVRRVDLWTKPEVREALCQTLGFVSEDEFNFDFVESGKPVPLQSYLPLDAGGAQSFSPDEVILFSGGLDSLAGTVESLGKAGRRVVLVSHQSSTMIAARQNRLIATLRDRMGPDRCFFIPVTVNKGNEHALEFTQRTRSFMFASLAFVIGRMFNQDNLSFYENGVVSINLPIAEHVLGARASRTTHPRFLADCGRLFSLLLACPFTVRNPYIWKTKTEVVGVLAANGAADLIPNSFSCTRVREATKSSQHCGVCSQCVDRRFAILAAGLSAHDPTENYAVDLFTGSHQTGSALTMVEGFVLRAQKLATMSRQAFAASYGQIFRAVEHLPGTPDENVDRIWNLHHRHGREVVSVVDHELQRRSSLAEALNLPSTSLLAMVHSLIATQPDFKDAAETEPTAAQQAAADGHDYKWESIRFAIDPAARRVIFQDGLEIGGSVHGLIEVLAKTFAADSDAGTFTEHHTFVKANVLAKHLRIDQPSLRQRISRCRKMISKAFKQRLGRDIATDDIIQNEGWKGYRLNPHLVLSKASQLRKPPSPLSQVDQRTVTRRGASR